MSALTDLLEFQKETEALAAIAWFSLVTWLVNRTGKFWDAVVAHAVTNLLLGIYVCTYSQWQLW